MISWNGTPLPMHRVMGKFRETPIRAEGDDRIIQQPLGNMERVSPYPDKICEKVASDLG